jgi:protein-S-isoprenylcysteine O-methyltransferase Ste14
MKKTLLKKGLTKYFAGLIIIILLIFVPAGSLRYVNGWLFIGLLFIPMLIMGVVLFVKNPTLLEKRLNAKENEKEQKGVVAISGIMFLAGFVVAGLNYRFDWWMLPRWAVIAASVMFIASYVMYAEVLRENAYLSRTVEVQEEQKVIDTGLYGVIRHPMYTATVFMFLAIPLVLGSFLAFLIFLIYPLTIILRIDNEEKVLEKGLAGYADYKKKVKHRLLPFIW